MILPNFTLICNTTFIAKGKTIWFDYLAYGKIEIATFIHFCDLAQLCGVWNTFLVTVWRNSLTINEEKKLHGISVIGIVKKQKNPMLSLSLR